MNDHIYSFKGVTLDTRIVVDDAHFEYLRLQKGNLDKYSANRSQWHELYERDLLRTYAEIRPYLPRVCWGFLDIGSGLGGIDVLIGRHYESTGGCRPYTHLLDGIDDPPVMHLHRETFNSMKVAQDFQTKNGLPSERFRYYGTREQFYRKPFDLVVSFGSWGFHYEPDVYLRELTKGGGLHVDSVLVMDLRRARGWENQLWAAGFRVLAVTRESAKFQRLVLAKDDQAARPTAA